MTAIQQIFVAIICIICLAIVAAAIVLGVIAYAELFLRDAESEGKVEEE